MKVRELQTYLLRADGEDEVKLYFGTAKEVLDDDYPIDSVSHNGVDSVIILAGDIVG